MTINNVYKDQAGSLLKKNRKLKGKPRPQALRNKHPRNAPCYCGSGKKYKHCHYIINGRKSNE